MRLPNYSVACKYTVKPVVNAIFRSSSSEATRMLSTYNNNNDDVNHDKPGEISYPNNLKFTKVNAFSKRDYKFDTPITVYL